MDNPLILHVENITSLRVCALVETEGDLVFQKFSPGPITGIFPKHNQDLFTAGLKTVAVRIPSNPTAREFLEACGVPVAAPSANLSGKPSLTKLEYILEEFSGKVDCILQGEEPRIGIESTVIDFTEDPPVLLRPGFVDQKDLFSVLPNLRILNTLDEIAESPRSPGLKYRHYAPSCKVVLADSLQSAPQSVAQIGFTFFLNSIYQVRVSSNEEYMKFLYSFFVECDRRKIAEAWCEIPKEGRGREALLNRISKAVAK